MPEDKQQVIILARGWGGGEGGRKLLSEILKCFETARNAAKLVII